MLERVCTLQNFAEVLGMLQCNVMEVEFASPCSQYISHLQQILQDVEDDENIMEEHDDDVSVVNTTRSHEGGGDAQDSTMNHLQDKALGEMQSWLETYETRIAETANQVRALDPIAGSGLFPILTLANHDCDPNASIEFLGESNKGSLVALRDIARGEEITITYIPNGDFDCGDEAGDRFRLFQPTRTWHYLNNDLECASDSDGSVEIDIGGCSDTEGQGGDLRVHSRNDMTREDCSHDSAHESNTNSIGDRADVIDKSEEDDCNGDEEDCDEDELVSEGMFYKDRATALLEYGFECKCSRCLHEGKAHGSKTTPYCRDT